MQLFRSESSDKYDKPLPRAAQIAVATVLAYLALIVACAAAYWALGMSLFDAVTHAMPTIATGGFANYDESFAWFKNPALEWAATLFMALGGLPLVVYVRMTLGQWREVVSNRSRTIESEYVTIRLAPYSAVLFVPGAVH